MLKTRPLSEITPEALTKQKVDARVVLKSGILMRETGELWTKILCYDDGISTQFRFEIGADRAKHWNPDMITVTLDTIYACVLDVDRIKWNFTLSGAANLHYGTMDALQLSHPNHVLMPIDPYTAYKIGWLTLNDIDLPEPMKAWFIMVGGTPQQ